MDTDFVMIRGNRFGEILEIPTEDLQTTAKLRWWLNQDGKQDAIVETSITKNTWERYLELTKPIQYSWFAQKRLALRKKVNQLFWRDKVPYFVLKFVWRVTPHVGL